MKFNINILIAFITTLFLANMRISLQDLKTSVFYIDEGDVRKEMNYKRIWIIIICFSSFINLFLIVKLFSISNNQNDQFQIFINDFAYQIDNNINLIESILKEQPDEVELGSKINLLTNNLAILDHMISRTPYYMKGQGGIPNDIDKIKNTIISGDSKHNIPPFLEDQKLNKKEKNFLEYLNKHLYQMLGEIYNHQNGGNRGIRLSKGQFDKFIQDYFILEDYYQILIEGYNNK
ncbi:hypothetical protein ACTWQB_11780 [Piscibacillus sp. B03]|uniref:hypothetical protein n=1 Tax=Piscibacillus sp. B03 TaxID=3457430 RepID=UPI003FCDC6D7